MRAFRRLVLQEVLPLVLIATSTAVDITDENAFGAFGDVHMSPAFSVGLSVDYWNDEYRSSPMRDVELGDVVIGAISKFNFTDLSANFRPYVLAGLAAHVLQVTMVGEVRYRRLFEQTLDLDQMNYTVALAYSM